ncbi:MAG: GNAT family N-acetyltransferase [Candidatus Limnocylindria bacterium]
MTDSYRLRRATAEDSRRAFDVFVPSVRDLATRLNTPWEVEAESLWERLQPLYDHLAEHAAEWWVAEDAADGTIIGYARSVARGGLLELSEFFVDPQRQSGGVGAALLERAFPADRGEVRAIIATTDVRAQARYYRAGTAARFPIVAMGATPRTAEPDPAVEIVRADIGDIKTLRTIEADVLEFDRGDEFGWLLGLREGYLYRRGGETIGFAFIGASGSGPIAALHPDDQVPILAHVESRAAALELPNLSVEVPMVNEVAIRHLIGRGFRMDTFFTFLMSSRPFGRFDRFIGFAPPFVL